MTGELWRGEWDASAWNPRVALSLNTSNKSKQSLGGEGSLKKLTS